MWRQWLRRFLDVHAPAAVESKPVEPLREELKEVYTSSDIERARKDGFRRGIEHERKKQEIADEFQYCGCGAPLILHKSGPHRWSSCPFDPHHEKPHITRMQPQQMSLNTDPLPRYPRHPGWQAVRIAQQKTEEISTVDRKKMRAVLLVAAQQEGSYL